MPKYTYKCNKCGEPKTELRKASQRKAALPCECGGDLEFQLPTTVQEPTVMETVDRRRNVKHRKDQDKRIRKRAHDFFVKNEMDDLIAKHGEEQSKKFGWLDKDGKKINKGGLK